MIASTEPMNVYGYGRTSTATQELSLIDQRQKVEKAFDFFQQINRLPAQAKFVKFFEDADSSASIPWFLRPAGTALLASVKRGDMIIVANYDRAIRSVKDVCDVMERLNEMGVFLCILDADVDTSTIMGEAFMTLIALIKQLERREIVRRTKEAKKFARENGLPVGGTAPVGYKTEFRKMPSGRIRPHYVVDQQERYFSKKAWEMINEHHLTYQQACKELAKIGCKNPKTKQPYTYKRVKYMVVAHEKGFPLPGGQKIPGRFNGAGNIVHGHNPDLD